MNEAFRDRVAVVTGGASGIGRALGAALLRRGARVTLADRDGARAAEEASALAAGGGRVSAVELDVTDAEAFARRIEAVVSSEGRIDYLFNNAGIGFAGEVRDMSLADWRKVMEVNLFGVVHGVAAAYPLMVRQGSGHIVNTASGAGLGPRPGMTAYAASKHAVVGLSTSLRGEAAGLGVKVSAVCPGYIRTGIMSATTYRNVDAERLLERIPIRPMSAERCAEVVLRGVARNRAIIPVTSVQWLDWLVYRIAPELSIRIQGMRGDRVRASRRSP